MDIALNSLNSWLLNERNSSGMDTKTFAGLSGVASSLVNHIENKESAITISTLVKICHGLGKLPNEFFNILGFSSSPPPYLQQARYGAHASANLPNCLTIEDIDAFLRYYSSEAQHAKSFLYLFYGRLLRITDSSLDTQSANYIAAEKISSAAFEHIALGAEPIPYPTTLQKKVLDNSFVNYGVTTLDDVGYYLRLARISHEKTLKEVSDLTSISESILSRIERGLNSRVRLSDILDLDRFYEENGKILGMYWLAAEFETGISRNKITFDGANIPPIQWHAEEYRLATTLHKIVRWQEAIDSTNKEWLIVLRSKNFYYLTVSPSSEEDPSYLIESPELHLASPADPPITNPIILAQVFEHVRKVLDQHLPFLTSPVQFSDVSAEEQNALLLWQNITQYLSTYQLAEHFLYVYEDIKINPTEINKGGLYFLLHDAMRKNANFTVKLQELLRKKP